jgi:VWFA-related protein
LEKGTAAFGLVGWAIRANVALYPVDARGGETLVPFGEAAAPYSFGSETSPVFGGFAMIDAMTGWMAARSAQWSEMREMASATGGQSVVGDNRLEAVFQRIEENGRGLYLLGFYLGASMLDGKFHRVEVKVGREHAEVRAKAGYYALRQ